MHTKRYHHNCFTIIIGSKSLYCIYFGASWRGFSVITSQTKTYLNETWNTRMWANAQPDGRPADGQRRKVWLTPTTRCRAVMLPRCKTR